MVFRRRIREAPAVAPSPGAVWIVQHDQSPHNTVLGVFATERDATAFAEEVKHQFPNGVIYSRFQVGYRFDRGPGHATYGPAD